LRRLPRGSPARDKLIGFGDPYFNADQAAEAEREQAAPLVVASATGGDGENVTRSIPLRLRASPHTEENDAATLAILPRLPDTRFELISMAEALEADPAKALYLGKAANEQNVETLDLSHYRIVAFSRSSSMPTGWFCPHATPPPAPGREPKRLRASAARSLMPEPTLSPIGRCSRPRRAN
jgi:hypothetical protein